MVNTVFDLYRGKPKTKFGFSSVFALKQAKEHILFQVQPLKLWRHKFLCAHFGVTVQIFKGLRPRKEATLRHAILELVQLGSYNSLAQHRMWSFYFSKSLHPNVGTVDWIRDEVAESETI